MRSQYRVRCINRTGKADACGWKGVRTAGGCECYDTVCHPVAPGLGCPNGVTWPCPRCNGKVTGRPVKHREPAGVS